MTEHNRSVVIAAIGALVLMLCGVYGYVQLQHSTATAYADYKHQPARDRVARVDPTGRVRLEAYQPKCQNPKNREDSALCAEWTAAQLAYEANRMTRINLVVGFLTFLFGIAGTSLLLWTLLETRHATYLQLRAYAAPGIVKITESAPGTYAICVPVVNSGQTPALNVNTYLEVYLTSFPIPSSYLHLVVNRNAISYAAIMPNDRRETMTYRTLDDVDLQALKGRTKCLVAIFAISYETYLGQPIHDPALRVFALEDELKEGTMSLISAHHVQSEETIAAAPPEQLAPAPPPAADGPSPSA